MRALRHLSGLFQHEERRRTSGLPSQKLCPRDAIQRKPIGKIDPEDPANNFYEYVIDEDQVRRLRQDA